ncbi:MAG: hypothetical protein MSH18_03635 [Bacteroidales bacterium]|nr:hypothetical protein [Bacteroidales bacterium]
MDGKYIITYLCCLFAISAAGSEQDTTAIANHRNEWQKILLSTIRDNPSFMHDTYVTSLTEFGVKGSYRKADSPLQLETGDGHLLGNLYMQSYLRLNPNNTVWGGASYQTGKKHHIRFNSTSDYDLLYPYVMADTIGGDIENERYAFNGGYALKIKKLTFGAEMDFRAEHEYRTTDPRPRGIVTDLTLRLGLAYDLKRYKIGAGLSGRVYKQTNNVEFYNPLGVIPEFHRTGLGTDYVRFAGTIRSAYYKGTGFMTDFRLAPLTRSGAYCMIEAGYMPYDKILTELNALPISRLEVHRCSVRLGWRCEGDFKWSVSSGWEMEYRRGNEHIAGNSSSTEYKSLITLSMFRNKRSDIYIDGALSMGRLLQLTLHAKIGHLDERSEYVHPQREMAFTKHYGSLSCQFLWRANAQWLLEWSGQIAYFHNASKRITMPYAFMDSQRTLLVNHTYRHKTAHLWKLGAQGSIYHSLKQWKGIGTFLKAALYYHRMSFLHQVETEASIGITF